MKTEKPLSDFDQKDRRLIYFLKTIDEEPQIEKTWVSSSNKVNAFDQWINKEVKQVFEDYPSIIEMNYQSLSEADIPRPSEMDIQSIAHGIDQKVTDVPTSEKYFKRMIIQLLEYVMRKWKNMYWMIN